MKLSAAITLFFASAASANPFRPASKANPKAAYMNKLVKNAKATRRLEQEIDLTGYSVKFTQCQFVKTYSDDLADDEDSTTVLATQRFVIFRLCPVDYCSTCDTGYGEYVIDLDTYLQSTVEYQQQLQEDMCDACDECAQEAEAEEAADGEDGGRRRLAVDCTTCYDECQKIENMEENGYIDATNFLQCEMIYDPEDDGKSALYAGPTCASYGTKIKIGVFTDENCNTIDASKDVEDYLKDGDGYQMKLSHALLKTTYAEDSCMSCIDANDNDADGNAAETNELCQALYEEAAKCEDSHGFTGGYNMYANNNNNNNNNNNQKNQWYNQEAQEELVCEFISSLQSGTYDETGEIILSGGSSVVGGGSKTTGGQKFALTFFILGTVGLAVYSAMLHSKLTKGGKAGLSTQGGAMA